MARFTKEDVLDMYSAAVGVSDELRERSLRLLEESRRLRKLSEYQLRRRAILKGRLSQSPDPIER